MSYCLIPKSLFVDRGFIIENIETKKSKFLNFINKKGNMLTQKYLCNRHRKKKCLYFSLF